MNPTSAIDVLMPAILALTPSERDSLHQRLIDLRIADESSEQTELGRYLESLRQVRDAIGHAPSPDEYRAAQKQLAAAGVNVEPLHRVIKFFGSWRQSKEALDLSQITTARKIQARFESRRLGKIWRYTDQTLAETLQQCAGELGHVPQVAEFTWWRERKLELARQRGEILHLPSPRPYRSRWGTWAAALLQLGFSQDAVDGRLDQTSQKPAVGHDQ